MPRFCRTARRSTCSGIDALTRLPESDAAALMHRSGECNCGSCRGFVGRRVAVALSENRRLAPSPPSD